MAMFSVKPVGAACLLDTDQLVSFHLRTSHRVYLNQIWRHYFHSSYKIFILVINVVFQCVKRPRVRWDRGEISRRLNWEIKKLFKKLSMLKVMFFKKLCFFKKFSLNLRLFFSQGSNYCFAAQLTLAQRRL